MSMPPTIGKPVAGFMSISSSSPTYMAGSFSLCNTTLIFLPTALDAICIAIIIATGIPNINISNIKVIIFITSSSQRFIFRPYSSIAALIYIYTANYIKSQIGAKKQL
jgi:hypothetical protein